MAEEERRSEGRFDDEEVAQLRRLASSLGPEPLQLLTRLLAREQALEGARKEREHYKKLCYESAIRWVIPVMLTAVLGFALWTWKLWVLAALAALRDVAE